MQHPWLGETCIATKEIKLYRKDFEILNSSFRYAPLGGDIPTPEQAAAKQAVLSEQLDSKLRQVSNCDLVLAELNRLADYLTLEAVDQMPQSLALSKQVN